MADTVWIENIKRIVYQAVEASDPCDVLSGTVVKEEPLEIQIGQKLVLHDRQIIRTEQFTNHEENMDISGIGAVSVIVKGALKVGEKVLLIQKRGGQQFVVIGRW